ncbi:MAG: PQQ-binding-like beta-propeller repeat protein [Acidobacteriota bacterium]|nr:PQQ-binding-like beta-propeller repeat protein [Acidobacteriota bacterium]
MHCLEPQPEVALIRFETPVVRTLALLGVLLAARGVHADSWPSFRGPNATGAARANLPAGDGPLALQLAWKRPLGSGYSGISVAAGKLVTAFQEDASDYFVALDPESGEEIWRYEVGSAYKGIDGSHDGPISTPAIADGRVFALGRGGQLVALDLATGEALWATHLVDDLGSEAPYYGFGSSPAVVGDTLVLQVGGEAGAVVGLDVATGEVRWRAVEDEVDAQSPIVVERGDSRQVLVLGGKRLAGLDPADGTVLWDFEHEGEPGGMGAMTSSPLPLDAGRFLVKYEDETSAVFEIGEIDGAQSVSKTLETRGMTRSYSPPAVAGDHVYGFTARFLSAVDPATGDLLWRTREVGDGFVVSVEDHLVVIQKTGSLHVGAVSPEGWSEASRIQLFDDLAWTPPTYADGAVYVRSLGEIARVDLVRSGERATVAEEEIVRPASLAALAEAVASSQDARATVDEFLEGRSLPIIDGENVVFLWRGEAEDVAVAGDMIGMRREEPMHRIEGTDLWWWETQLDRRARMSYLFYPDYAPAIDPSHDRVVTATVLGPDMNWFRGVPVEMSWFAMPEWPGWSVTSAEPATRGRLESVPLSIQPAATEGEEPPETIEIEAQVWLPPGYDESDARYPVVYAPGDARGAGRWPETLDRVVGRSVEPLIVAFVDLPRRRDLRGALVTQVVPQIDERYRTKAERESRALVGMGWAGRSAAVAAFTHSDAIGVLGVQSLFLVKGPPMEALEGAIGDDDASSLEMKIYLEWGKWDLTSPHEEMNQRKFSRWAWDLLSEKGWQPIGGEVWDSTDFASWANRTDVLLEALFPLTGAATKLPLWQTGAP